MHQDMCEWPLAEHVRRDYYFFSQQIYFDSWEFAKTFESIQNHKTHDWICKMKWITFGPVASVGNQQNEKREESEKEPKFCRLSKWRLLWRTFSFLFLTLAEYLRQPALSLSITFVMLVAGTVGCHSVHIRIQRPSISLVDGMFSSIYTTHRMLYIILCDWMRCCSVHFSYQNAVLCAWLGGPTDRLMYGYTRRMVNVYLGPPFRSYHSTIVSIYLLGRYWSCCSVATPDNHRILVAIAAFMLWFDKKIK